MRVTVLKPFWGRLDGASHRTLLAVGSRVTLSESDPHTQTLLSGGYAELITDGNPNPS